MTPLQYILIFIIGIICICILKKKQGNQKQFDASGGARGVNPDFMIQHPPNSNNNQNPYQQQYYYPQMQPIYHGDYSHNMKQQPPDSNNNQNPYQQQYYQPQMQPFHFTTQPIDQSYPLIQQPPDSNNNQDPQQYNQPQMQPFHFTTQPIDQSYPLIQQPPDSNNNQDPQQYNQPQMQPFHFTTQPIDQSYPLIQQPPDSNNNQDPQQYNQPQMQPFHFTTQPIDQSYPLIQQPPDSNNNQQSYQPDVGAVAQSSQNNHGEVSAIETVEKKETPVYFCIRFHDRLNNIILNPRKQKGQLDEIPWLSKDMQFLIPYDNQQLNKLYKQLGNALPEDGPQRAMDFIAYCTTRFIQIGPDNQSYFMGIKNMLKNVEYFSTLELIQDFMDKCYIIIDSKIKDIEGALLFSFSTDNKIKVFRLLLLKFSIYAICVELTKIPQEKSRYVRYKTGTAEQFKEQIKNQIEHFNNEIIKEIAKKFIDGSFSSIEILKQLEQQEKNAFEKIYQNIRQIKTLKNKLKEEEKQNLKTISLDLPYSELESQTRKLTEDVSKKVLEKKIFHQLLQELEQRNDLVRGNDFEYGYLIWTMQQINRFNYIAQILSGQIEIRQYFPEWYAESIQQFLKYNQILIQEKIIYNGKILQCERFMQNTYDIFVKDSNNQYITRYVKLN